MRKRTNGTPSLSLRHALAIVAVSLGAASLKAPAQSLSDPDAGRASTTQEGVKSPPMLGPQQESPIANPGRPTVSTPATLTPLGYIQFESGVLAAWHSPGVSTQVGLNQVTKFSIARRVELLAASGPFVHSDTSPANGTGGLSLGVQGVVRQGEGARPTLALSYVRQVIAGDAPDLDVGSAGNSLAVLASADMKGFHFDTNYLFNEVANEAGVRRVQFGQTLSVSHGLGARFGLSGELWDFSQPFLRSHAVGNLWAFNCNARRNLVFDAGLNRGLTSTSTHWELAAGFTYLLPRRLHVN